jgi:hypothetical protein
MTTPAQRDLSFKKGRKGSVQYTFKDSDGVARDLSAYTFQGQARENADPTSTLITTFSIDETNKATGIIIITVDDTASSISVDTGSYDLVGVDGSSKPWTFLFGYISFGDSPTVVV